MRWIKLLGLLVIMALVVLAAGCGLSGSGSSVSQTPMQKPGESQTPPVSPQPTREKVEVTLYFGDDQAMYLKPEKRTVEKGGKPLGEILLQELIQGPQDKALNKTIPPETRLLSLEVANGIAYANFSREIKTKHWGGSAGETMTVQSIVQTLTQLPEIKKVQFLIEGQKEYAIWGHGATEEPIGPAQNIVVK